jgi:hypothetical protein
LSLAFAAYDLLLIAFAIMLPSAIGVRSRSIRIGFTLLALVGVAGLGMSTAFPTDHPGDPITMTGGIHVTLAAVASLGSMGAVVAFAIGLRRDPEWRGFAMGSFVTVAAIFTSGIWAATAAAQMSPIFGIAERATIGIFVAWLLVVSMLVLRRALR